MRSAILAITAAAVVGWCVGAGLAVWGLSRVDGAELGW